jgi:NCS1 family nucleobase:cation symporter-1
MVAYLVAIAVEVPFMNTTFYTGPMVSHLGGGDISWILGLIVASGLYFLLHGSLRAGVSGGVAPAAPTAATERTS